MAKYIILNGKVYYITFWRHIYGVKTEPISPYAMT